MSNEVKHTPGPWSLERRHAHHQDYTTINAGGWTALAEVVVALDGNESAEGQANARLLAAAPDLLAGLLTVRNALGQIEQGIATDIPGNIAVAEAAISKAWG